MRRPFFALVLSGFVLAVAGPTRADVAELAESACIRSGGDFAMFDSIMAGSDSLHATDLSSFAHRTVGRSSAYRAGRTAIELIDLPAGRYRVVAPIQTPGELPTMWEQDLPHVVVCRVTGPAADGDLALRIGAWTIKGRVSERLGDVSSEKGMWRFGEATTVAVSTPDAQSRMITVGFQKP